MVTEFLGDWEIGCLVDELKDLDVCRHKGIYGNGTEFCAVCGVEDLGNCGIKYLRGEIK